jgi:hypothetical protein
MKSKILLAMLIATFLLITGSNQVFALRNIEDNSNVAGNISREETMKQQILAAKKAKIMSGVRTQAVKIAPVSYPMPTREEMAAARAANSAVQPGNTPAQAPVKALIMQDEQAVQAREQAFQQEETKNMWIIYCVPVALVLLIIGSIIFLIRMNKANSNQGSAILLAMILILIIFVTGATLVYLTQNESNKSVKSSLGNGALYVADGGVEKALWEINRTVGYSGESDTSLGSGTFSVAVSTPGGNPNQREIISSGVLGQYHRKIKAISERVIGNIAINSALAAGGNVSIGGNAHIAGGTTTGVLVPVGNNVNTFGGGTVNGTPPTGNAPFPDFEDVFNMTEAQMKGLANTKYVFPPNNSPADGITWVDGNFKITTHGWHGSGILVITGDFEITGGDFEGVIYVKGSFKMAGNAEIHGGILTQSMADVAAIIGTADITYDASAISAANNLYPFKIIAWQEVKN